MNIAQALQSFVQYLRVGKNASKKTVEQYSSHIWAFMGFMVPESVIGMTVRETYLELIKNSPQKTHDKQSFLTKYPVSVESLKKSDFFEFRLFLEENGRSVTTINAYMVSIRVFLRFLHKEEIPCVDPSSIDLLKMHDREVSFLEPSEVVTMIESFDCSTMQ